MKKYELTDEVRWHDGTKVFRIRALRDFGDVKAGDLGGFIEKEKNLSHEGTAWVYDNAIVEDNAVITDRAVVDGDAIIKGDALVAGDVHISDGAYITSSFDYCSSKNAFGDFGTTTLYTLRDIDDTEDEDEDVGICNEYFCGTLSEFITLMFSEHRYDYAQEAINITLDLAIRGGLMGL